MTPNQAKVQKAVEDTIARAKVLFPSALLDFHISKGIPVRFDIRGYRLAGQAGYSPKKNTMYLRFHPEAVEKQLDAMLKEVVPHEVAHLVCFGNKYYGARHNRGWKMVCTMLGGTGVSTHSMTFGKVPTIEERRARRLALRPHVYVDSKGVARRVTTKCHKKIQRGAVYGYRDNGGRVDQYSPYQYAPANTFTFVNNRDPKPTTQPDLGGKSKADVARALIKVNYGHMTEHDLVQLIAQKAGLSPSLAKKYFSNNLAKAFQS